MNTTLLKIVSVLSFFMLMSSIGCSSGSNNPLTPSHDIDTSVGTETTEESVSHHVMNLFDVTFDPETGAFEATEVRNGQTHYNITPYLSGSVSFVLIIYDPIAQLLEFEMTLTNPSAIDVYDVRTIFLTDAASGYRLLNPDDYTKLFNPYAPGVVNPFIAYCKTTTDRKFAPLASDMQLFSVRTPMVVSLPLKFKLLVECSWPSNCDDPYEISNQAISNPISTTTSGTISLDAYDHQDNIGSVYVDTTPITGGLTWLAEGPADHWTGSLFNSAGAAPGVYACMITADSFACADNLYDFIDITVVPAVIPPGSWIATDYNLPVNSSNWDLGVIADPGGPRDSKIVMSNSTIIMTDEIAIIEPHYSSSATYATLNALDAKNPDYMPYPVQRIDAADDGAFSFTNDNPIPIPTLGSWIINSQIWTVFDNKPTVHIGPMSDESRYWFDFLASDVVPYPVDVCDDFSLGQYSLFTTEEMFSPEDLSFVGTMPGSYTRDRVMYYGNLDSYIGPGAGHVDNTGILGIDVIANDDTAIDTAKLYVLEYDGQSLQVEVFEITDTAPAWGPDTVAHKMTIDIIYPVDAYLTGHDIEILPVNHSYQQNPNDETLAVLVEWSYGAGSLFGEVLLYNATTGAFVESIGDPMDPTFNGRKVHFLDTDDDNWTIHVTNQNATGLPLATILEYI